MPEPFCDLASPGHCPWWCTLEKHRGNNGHWKPHCEVAAPERYDDMAVVALMHNPLHAQEKVAANLYYLTTFR
jgi:hypothetical protein